MSLEDESETEGGKVGGEAEHVVRSLLAHPYTRAVAIRFLLLNYRKEIIDADKAWCERIEGIVQHTWRPWYTPGIAPPEGEIIIDRSPAPLCFPSDLGIDSLTNPEKTVLIALVKEPSATLESIARKINMASSQICELRRKSFIKLNLPPIDSSKTASPKKNRAILIENYEKIKILLKESGFLEE